VYASTQILGKRGFPGRPDLGIVESRLFGWKHVREGEAWKRVQIFELDRQSALKRRSHYT
jgi:hypothetical protein